MKKILIVSAVLLISSSELLAQKNTTINLTKGQKYIVENKITTKGSSEMQGQSIESDADVTSTFSIEIKDLTGDNYNMLNSVSAIKMNMNMMGQNINFDSENKEDMDGEIGSKLKNFINQPKAVVMNKSGDLIASNENDTSKNSEMEILLQQMGDPEAQGYGAKMAFFPLPKKIKAGDSWKDSTSEEGVTRVTNYTVKEIKGDTASVSIEGTENRDTKIEIQGMEVTTKTTGKFSGNEMIDRKTGVILQNTTTTDSIGSVNVMGQDVPMTAKVTSATTVKPK